jgi:hypothetical protein
MSKTKLGLLGTTSLVALALCGAPQKAHAEAYGFSGDDILGFSIANGTAGSIAGTTGTSAYTNDLVTQSNGLDIANANHGFVQAGISATDYASAAGSPLTIAQGGSLTAAQQVANIFGGGQTYQGAAEANSGATSLMHRAQSR